MQHILAIVFSPFYVANKNAWKQERHSLGIFLCSFCLFLTWSPSPLPVAHGDLHLSVFLQTECANAWCAESARSSHRSFCSGLRSLVTVESPLVFMVSPPKLQQLFPIMGMQRKSLAGQLLGPSLPWVASDGREGLKLALLPICPFCQLCKNSNAE